MLTHITSASLLHVPSSTIAMITKHHPSHSRYGRSLFTAGECGALCPSCETQERTKGDTMTLVHGKPEQLAVPRRPRGQEKGVEYPGASNALSDGPSGERVWGCAGGGASGAASDLPSQDTL